MRLLKTETCELVEAKDLPRPFPDYAILSHTWISPEGEITYQDMKERMEYIKNGTFKREGWSKLEEYCRRAKSDGWMWAWMDTCCIDKTNPADTQEAINAMFRWYQNARVCYAYLEDVDLLKVLKGLKVLKVLEDADLLKPVDIHKVLKILEGVDLLRGVGFLECMGLLKDVDLLKRIDLLEDMDLCKVFKVFQVLGDCIARGLGEGDKVLEARKNSRRLEGKAEHLEFVDLIKRIDLLEVLDDRIKMGLRRSAQILEARIKPGFRKCAKVLRVSESNYYSAEDADPLKDVDLLEDVDFLRDIGLSIGFSEILKPASRLGARERNRSPSEKPLDLLEDSDGEADLPMSINDLRAVLLKDKGFLNAMRLLIILKILFKDESPEMIKPAGLLQAAKRRLKDMSLLRDVGLFNVLKILEIPFKYKNPERMKPAGLLKAFKIFEVLNDLENLDEDVALL
jgi:hypothetical protein